MLSTIKGFLYEFVALNFHMAEQIKHNNTVQVNRNQLLCYNRNEKYICTVYSALAQQPTSRVRLKMQFFFCFSIAQTSRSDVHQKFYISL